MALSPAVFLGSRSERTRAVGRSDALRSAQTSLRTASLRTDCSALSWMRSDSTQLQSSLSAPCGSPPWLMSCPAAICLRPWMPTL